MGFEEILENLADKPLLKEFAEWLYEHKCYGEDAIEELLCKEWDGAYPSALISDDLLVDIGSFLCFMAMFALEKVYGEDWWTAKSPLHVSLPRLKSGASSVRLGLYASSHICWFGGLTAPPSHASR